MRLEASLLLVLAGCSAQRVALVDATAWEVLDASEDPFDDAPTGTTCSPSAVAVEVEDGEPVLEISTDTCPYVLLGQPTLERVRAGDLIVASAAHDELESDEPAEGHLGLAVGDWTVLDARESIPSAAADLDGALVAEADLPAGSLVTLHLHNHGANTWTVSAVTSGPRGLE